MGLVWQQAAFTGHDLGHNAVFHDKARDDRWAVFVGNFLGGVSIGWWKATHNVGLPISWRATLFPQSGSPRCHQLHTVRSGHTAHAGPRGDLEDRPTSGRRACG